MTTPAGPGYPITFEFDPAEKIARWRPLVHWLLSIPYFVVMYILLIVAGVLAFVGWILGVITGRIPEGILSPIALFLRWNVRYQIYSSFLREEYPPFAFDAAFQDPGDYPAVRLNITPQLEGRSRLTIFFRYFMVIPHGIVLFFLAIAVFVVQFIAFFAVIITGNWPTGMRNFVIGYIRWTTRVAGYFHLLTDEYPPFSLN